MQVWTQAGSLPLLVRSWQRVHLCGLAGAGQHVGLQAGDMERAELRAVPAAVAQLGLHSHGASRGVMLQRAGGAYLDAGCLLAMEAAALQKQPLQVPLAVFILLEGDARPGFG